MAHIVLPSSGKPFRWSAAKNARLVAERGVSFEDVVAAIGRDGLLDVYRHPNAARYPNQWLLVVVIRGYAYAVPVVDDAECLFLKTIVPSRKATRRYLGKEAEDQETPGAGG